MARTRPSRAWRKFVVVMKRTLPRRSKNMDQRCYLVLRQLSAIISKYFMFRNKSDCSCKGSPHLPVKRWFKNFLFSIVKITHGNFNMCLLTAGLLASSVNTKHVILWLKNSFSHLSNGCTDAKKSKPDLEQFWVLSTALIQGSWGVSTVSLATFHRPRKYLPLRLFEHSSSFLKELLHHLIQNQLLSYF